MQLGELRPGRMYALRVVPLPDVQPPLAVPPPQPPSQPALLTTLPMAPHAPPAPITTRRERKALLVRSPLLVPPPFFLDSLVLTCSFLGTHRQDRSLPVKQEPRYIESLAHALCDIV